MYMKFGLDENKTTLRSDLCNFKTYVFEL